MKNFKLYVLGIALLGCLNTQAQSSLPPIKVTLGQSANGTATLDNVIENPRLTVNNPISWVTDFTVTITQPDGKQFGPFTNKGSQLTEAQIAKLKEFRNKKVSIVLTNIHLDAGNDHITAKDMTLKFGK